MRRTFRRPTFQRVTRSFSRLRWAGPRCWRQATSSSASTAVDYSGYPDCRPEFIDAFEQLASLATRAGVEGKTIRVRTPLMTLSKAEIITLGASLGRRLRPDSQLLRPAGLTAHHAGNATVAVCVRRDFAPRESPIHWSCAALHRRPVRIWSVAQPLRRQILLLTLAILLPVFAAAAWSTRETYQEQLKQLEAEAFALAGSLVVYLERGLDINDIQTVIGTIPLPPDAIITITDEQHMVLARNQDAQHYVGQQVRALSVIFSGSAAACDPQRHRWRRACLFEPDVSNRTVADQCRAFRPMSREDESGRCCFAISASPWAPHG